MDDVSTKREYILAWEKLENADSSTYEVVCVGIGCVGGSFYVAKWLADGWVIDDVEYFEVFCIFLAHYMR